MSEAIMKLRRFSKRNVILVLMLGLCCLSCVVAPAQAQPAPATPAKTSAAVAPVGARAFATPDAAADALIKAAGDFDVDELLAILGPEGKDIVASKDTVQDKNHAEQFAKDAAVKKTIQISKSNPNRATLSVGENDWPFPVP